MKSYRPFAELLAELHDTLAASSRVGARLRPIPQVQHAQFGPLPPALDLVARGRHYARLQLVLRLDDARTAEISVGDKRPLSPSLTVPLRIGGHEFGELRVVADSPDRFGPEDRVFLTQVARYLAAFLGEKGRYVVTRLRLQGSQSASVFAFPHKSSQATPFGGHPAAKASGS